MNTAKEISKIDGKNFLREALAVEQDVLQRKLELSARSITHNGVMGEVNEKHFVEILQRYLPRRYAVTNGIVIDCNGSTSDQIDAVIYDPHYTPTLLDQQSHRFIPAEAVYAVLEVKPTLNKGYLDYAGEKAASVRRLERTSVPIRHAGGEYAPKPLFQIIAGIVAANVDWVDGCASIAFENALQALPKEKSLDCGVALSDRAFNTFSGSIKISGATGALAVFIFSLLHQLQTVGTAPAVDWLRYGAVLGDGGT